MGLALPKDDPREHRNRVLKGASILTGINQSEVQCTVRNMHANGAELKIPDGVRIPDEFLLYVPIDGIAYRSVVRWRKPRTLGVMFTATEPKPSWHYG